MQQTQLITYGIDGPLLERLRAAAQADRYWLRETHQLSACARLTWTAAPAGVVLVLGKELERELAYLADVHAALPATWTLAVGLTDNPLLAGLAWDVGVTLALFPPRRPDEMVEIIPRMLALR